MDKHQELVELIRSFSTYSGIIWAIIALILLFMGWKYARQGNAKVHKRYMIALLAGSVIAFEFWIMSFRYPQLMPHIPEGLESWVQLPHYLMLIPLVGATLMVIARWRRSQPGEFLGHFNTHHRVFGRSFVAVWALSYLGSLLFKLL